MDRRTRSEQNEFGTWKARMNLEGWAGGGREAHQEGHAWFLRRFVAQGKEGAIGAFSGRSSGWQHALDSHSICHMALNMCSFVVLTSCVHRFLLLPPAWCRASTWAMPAPPASSPSSSCRTTSPAATSATASASSTARAPATTSRATCVLPSVLCNAVLIHLRVHVILVFVAGELADSNTLLQDWHPAFGFVNNCDGSRSHSYCDYRQQ